MGPKHSSSQFRKYFYFIILSIILLSNCPSTQGRNSPLLLKELQDSVLTEIGRWGEGPCYTVRPVGDYVAVGNGSVLQVLDFNDPLNPVLVGEVLTESIIEDMEVKGNFLFKISPFQVIDISNPADPLIVYTDTIGFGATEITIEGDYAYIGDFVGYIYIIDISNPLKPKQLGFMLASGENVLSIAVKEPFLYASTSISFLVDIFDISDKNSPKDTSRYWTTSVAPVLKVYNNFLFEAGASYPGFKIFEIGDSLSLTLLGTVDIGHHVSEITINDTLVYLTGAGQDSVSLFGVLTILNISDITQPKVLNTIQINEPPFGTAQHLLKDEIIYTALGRGLTILNVNDAFNPEQIGYYSTSFATGKITVKENYAFIASYYVGMKVVDFANPSKPKTVGEFLTNSPVYDLALAGDNVFLYTDTALISLDISDPTKPKKIGQIHISAPDNELWEYKTLTISGSYAFTTYNDSSITIYNIKNPGNMNIYGKIKTTVNSFKVGAICLQDSLLIYSAEGDSGLQIYSWSNTFSRSNSIKENLPVLGLCLKDKELYLASDVGLNIYTLSDPRNPIKISRTLMPTGSYPEISISGKSLYWEADEHLVVIDINDLTKPKIVEDAIYSSLRNIASSEDIVLLGILLNGMKILKNNLVTDLYDFTSDNLIYDFELYPNYPNPFNPTTNLGFRISNFGFVTLKIYDVLGNEIATIINEEKPPGEYKLEFDASNLSSGIYFCSLRTEGKRISIKMCLIK